MKEHQQILGEEIVESTVEQPYTEATSNSNNDGLLKTAIGAVVGAVVGAVAINVARHLTVENVNKTVKGVGEAFKGAADGVNSTAKGVGDAVKSVAENANSTVQDVGESLKYTAEDFNQNIKGTVDVVRTTTQSLNSNIEGVANVVKNTTQAVNDTVKGAVDVAYEQEIVTDEDSKDRSNGTQTGYVLVPVEKGIVVGQPIPVDMGKVAPGGAKS